MKRFKMFDARTTLVAAVFAFAALSGCAQEAQYVDNTPKVHLLRRTSSVDIGEIGFGESLWLKRSVQNDEHYSDGRVVSAKNTDLMFCRDVPGTGPVCRPVSFADQEAGQAQHGVNGGTTGTTSGVRVPMPPVASVAGSQDNDAKNKDVATQCRELCPQFVNQSRNEIPDSTQRSQIALKCVEQCRMSGTFLLCMTQSKVEQLWDKCSRKMD